MIRPKTLLLSLVGGGAGVICALMLSAGTAHSATPTTQVGLVNANVPVNVNDVAVAVVGHATANSSPEGPPTTPSNWGGGGSSDAPATSPSGWSGGGETGHTAAPTTQVGLVNANAPVNVSDVAVAVVGHATANNSSDAPATTPSGWTGGASPDATQSGGPPNADPPTGVAGVVTEPGSPSTPPAEEVSSPPAGEASDPPSVTQQIGLVNANAPVNVSDVAVGVLGHATATTPPDGPGGSRPTGGSTQQVGLVNANVPVNVCGISAAVLGRASSECAPTGGSTQQVGLVNANVPVNVCGISAAVLGRASSECARLAARPNRSVW